MRRSTLTPSALRDRARTAWILGSLPLVISLIVAFAMSSVDVALIAGAVSLVPLFWGALLGWDEHDKATLLERIESEELVRLTFSPLVWRKRMQEEAERVVRPRWLIPTIAAVAAAFAVPFLAGDGQPTGRLSIAILGLVAFGIWAAKSGARRRATQRAAQGLVVLSQAGARVGDELHDFGMKGRLLALRFDKARSELVAHYRVRGFRDYYETETLIPLPGINRSDAERLVMQLGF